MFKLLVTWKGRGPNIAAGGHSFPLFHPQYQVLSTLYWQLWDVLWLCLQTHWTLVFLDCWMYKSLQRLFFFFVSLQYVLWNSDASYINPYHDLAPKWIDTAQNLLFTSMYQPFRYPFSNKVPHGSWYQYHPWSVAGVQLITNVLDASGFPGNYQ